jgi:tripartite ATP-independent transporter DctM subunit
MSGIGATATVTMGLIALPEMLQKKYNKHLTVGCITAGGALGPIIPPSNVLIIVGGYASLSVGKLFLGGFLPGVIIATCYCIYIYVRCKMRPEDGPVVAPEEIPTLGEKLRALPQVSLPLLVILIVLGTIYTGFSTPTESASFGALGAIIIALINRQLTLKNFYESLLLAFKVTVMIMWLVIGGSCYSSLVTTTGMSAAVSGFLAGSQFGVWGAIAIMLVITIIMGMFIDPVAICMICIPVFKPVCMAMGIDVFWFMMVFSIATVIGYITPPFGLNIFYMKGVIPGDMNLRDIYKGVLPYCCVKMACLILFILFPPLLTWLPSFMD